MLCANYFNKKLKKVINNNNNWFKNLIKRKELKNDKNEFQDLKVINFDEIFIDVINQIEIKGLDQIDLVVGGNNRGASEGILNFISFLSKGCKNKDKEILDFLSKINSLKIIPVEPFKIEITKNCLGETFNIENTLIFMRPYLWQCNQIKIFGVFSRYDTIGFDIDDYWIDFFSSPQNLYIEKKEFNIGFANNTFFKNRHKDKQIYFLPDTPIEFLKTLIDDIFSFNENINNTIDLYEKISINETQILY